MTRRSATVIPFRRRAQTLTTVDRLRTNIQTATSSNRHLNGTSVSIHIVQSGPDDIEVLVAIHLSQGGSLFGHVFHDPRTDQAHAILVFSDWRLPSNDATQALAVYRHHAFRLLRYLPLHAHELGDVYAIGSTAVHATELLTGMLSRLSPATALQEDGSAPAPLDLGVMDVYWPDDL